MSRGAIRKLWSQGASGDCSSGKVAFSDRRSARASARRTPGHVRPYRCPECSLWHVGHIPQAAMAGRMSSNDVYMGVSRG